MIVVDFLINLILSKPYLGHPREGEGGGKSWRDENGQIHLVQFLYIFYKRAIADAHDLQG